MLNRLRCIVSSVLCRALPSLFLNQPKHQKRSAHASSQLTEAVLALLQQTLIEGHTRLSLPTFYERCERAPELRNVPAEELLVALQTLQRQARIRLTESWLALAHCVAAEQQIAAGLAQVGSRLRRLNERSLSVSLAESTASLSLEQQAAVRQLAPARVGILTGAPGTGKTATLKALVQVLERAGYRIELTAPTGRAALRLQEATGKPARTLHRFLRAHQVRRSTLWHWFFPAAPEAIIVDEASMVDTILMARLLVVCTPRPKLILVGDVNQLPSVGPGQVLCDVIASGCVPVARLTTNFRQTEGSQIIAAAEAIKAGTIPNLPAPGKAKSDCYFLAAHTASEAAQLLVKAVTSSLPARCGADPYQAFKFSRPNIAARSVCRSPQCAADSVELSTPCQSCPAAAGEKGIPLSTGD